MNQRHCGESDERNNLNYWFNSSWIVQNVVSGKGGATIHTDP